MPARGVSSVPKTKVERLPFTESASTGRTSSKAESLPNRWLAKTPAARRTPFAELDSRFAARGGAEDGLPFGERVAELGVVAVEDHVRGGRQSRLRVAPVRAASAAHPIITSHALHAHARPHAP